MRRDHVDVGGGSMMVYGHFGRPFLVFPTEGGTAYDFEQHGMIHAVADLIEAGRVKLYCVDSADSHTWSDRTVAIEERAHRHEDYESWIRSSVAPWVADDCGGALEMGTLGCSMGAFHAVNLALRHAHVFPFAIGLSGNYDPTTWHAWGEPGDATYFNNPMAYVRNLAGGHLDWLRARLSLLLVVGQGPFEVSPTGALPSTVALADLLASKGIRHELDVWGYDVPHDWESWQRQLRHHLPRMC